MKLLPSFMLVAAALTCATATAAQAASIPDIVRLTGCTKDNMTASTHIGVFDSAKNRDETRTILNRHYRELTARHTGNEAETETFEKSVIENAGRTAAAELGPKASVTGRTFYSKLKPGCDLQTPPTRGPDHP